eukprot:191304-Ditylum_brightwellii.AAC.1
MVAKKDPLVCYDAVKGGADDDEEGCSRQTKKLIKAAQKPMQLWKHMNNVAMFSEWGAGKRKGEAMKNRLAQRQVNYTDAYACVMNSDEQMEMVRQANMPTT